MGFAGRSFCHFERRATPVIDPDIDAEARRRYEAMDTSKPLWEQLGGVTQAVWRERVTGDNTWPFKEAIAREPTVIVEQPRKLTLKERIDAKRAGQQGQETT